MPRSTRTEEKPVPRKKADSSAPAPKRHKKAAPAPSSPEVEVSVDDPVAKVSTEDAKASTEDIARLAYSFWMERGCKGGSPEEDWYRAIQELERV